MKKTAKILVLILSLCLICGAVALTTVFADTDAKEVTFDYYFGDSNFSAGKVAQGDTFALPANLDYVIVNRTEGTYVNGAQAVTWTWNMNASGEYDAENFHPADASAFNFDTVYANFIQKGNKLIIKAELADTAVATAKGFMIVDYVDGFEKVCPISATGTYDYLQELDTAAEIAPAFRALIAPGSEKKSYASGKTLVLTCLNLLPNTGANAEAKRGGFDLYADVKAQSGTMELIGSDNNITIDLNGRTLTIAWSDGTCRYRPVFYAGKKDKRNSFTIYSSIPGGELFEERYDLDLKDGNSTIKDGTISKALFTSEEKGMTINLGRYENPNTGVVSDGDNLSMAVSALYMPFSYSSVEPVNINIDGGDYQFYGSPDKAVVYILGDGSTVNIKNATLNNATRAPFFDVRGTNSVVNIDNAEMGHILLGKIHSYIDNQFSVGFGFAQKTNTAPITISHSKIAVTAYTGTKNNPVPLTCITLGAGNTLIGGGWDQMALADGVERSEAGSTSFTITAKTKCIPGAGALFGGEGTNYYLTDEMFADTNLTFTGAAVCTERDVTVTYKDGQGNIIDTVTLKDGDILTHPAKTPLGKSNGWYALAVDADGWTVPDGSKVNGDIEVTPVTIVPIEALKLMWNAQTANYPIINIYVPHMKDASGNEILPEGLTYTVSGISENGFKQVDSEGTQWMSYASGNTSIAQASSWINFTVSYSFTYGGETYDFSETVKVTPANYAESVVYDEQTNEAEKMWAYAWLNYLYRSFDACNAGAANATNYTTALAAFENEAFYKNYAEGKLDDYEGEIVADAAAADADDYAALEDFEGVLGFAWAYHYGCPNIVIYLDESKTVAADATKVAGKITKVSVAGLNSYLSNSTPANKVFNSWGKTKVTVDTNTYDAIWCNNVTKGMNDILSDIEIIVTYYTDTDGKTATVSGTYSLADYIAWATSTESGLADTRELAAAKSAYIFALAHRDFKASNAQ